MRSAVQKAIGRDPANQRLKMLRWKLTLGGEDATSYLLCNSDYEWVRIDAD